MRVALSLLIVSLLALVLAAGASSHRIGKWSPGPDNARNAIYWAFCGHRYVVCWRGQEAERVSSCETGGTFSVWADNGQYENIFQMGYSERQTYGWHTIGSNPWKAAAAAYRYYLRSGWGPWECKP